MFIGKTKDKALVALEDRKRSVARTNEIIERAKMFPNIPLINDALVTLTNADKITIDMIPVFITTFQNENTFLFSSKLNYFPTKKGSGFTFLSLDPTVIPDEAIRKYVPQQNEILLLLSTLNEKLSDEIVNLERAISVAEDDDIIMFLAELNDFADQKEKLLERLVELEVNFQKESKETV